MKYCPKWWCAGVMRTKKVRRLALAGAQVTVLKRYCPTCGWAYEDYRVQRRKAAAK
jgi:hypothetical protein